MRKYIFLLSLFASSTMITTGCTPADALKLLKPSGGVQAELTVGDKNQTVQTELGNQDAETITNTTVQQIPWWMFVISSLGWFVPRPQTLFKMWMEYRASKKA